MKFKAKLTKFGWFSKDVEGEIELIPDIVPAPTPDPIPDPPPPDPVPPPIPPTNLVDQQATLETRSVYAGLKEARGKYTYFGQMEYSFTHQGRLADQSFKMTGKHPKVLGVDKDDYTLPGTGAGFFEPGIRKHHDAGGFVNFFGGFPNLAGKGNKARNDLTGDPVNAVLPGGSHHEKFIAHTKNYAEYLKGLKGDDGKSIPILFRPFHEMDGDWDWWGTKNSTPEKFKQLWIMIFNLMASNGAHNIIWVWAPGYYKSNVPFNTYYPGDNYVDIIGVDRYTQNSAGTNNNIGSRYYVWPDQEAKKRNKLFAITEGMRKLNNADSPIEDYWTERYLNPIKNSELEPVYVMVWFTMKKPRWGPRENQWDSQSFKQMVKDPYLRMLGD